jgi:hypothetical protein
MSNKRKRVETGSVDSSTVINRVSNACSFVSGSLKPVNTTALDNGE